MISFLGNFYRHLAIFSGHTEHKTNVLKYKYFFLYFTEYLRITIINYYSIQKRFRLGTSGRRSTATARPSTCAWSISQSAPTVTPGSTSLASPASRSRQIWYFKSAPTSLALNLPPILFAPKKIQGQCLDRLAGVENTGAWPHKEKLCHRYKLCCFRLVLSAILSA